MTETPGILYLSIDGLLSPLGRSQILSYGLRLAKLGFRFHFISMEQEEALRDVQLVDRLRSQLAEAGAEWTPLPYRMSPRGLSARVSNVRELSRAAAKAVSAGQVRLIHARSYLPAYVANRLRRSFGVPYLFDMRGCWIDECREQGRGFTDPVTYWLGKHIERRLVGNAAGVVTLTEIQAKDLGLDSGKHGSVTRVIRTCCDLQQFACAPGALEGLPASAAEKLRGNVICWVGAINSAYLLAPSLELFKRVRALDDNAILLCLTQQVEQMRGATRAHGIAEGDVLIASVSYEEMPLWLSCAHWGLLLMQSTPARRGAMPTKLAEFLAAGVRPVQFGCNEEVTEIVNRSGTGIILSSIEPEEMQRVAESIAQQVRPGRMPQPEAGVLEEFDLNTGVREYAKAYKELLERPAPVK